MGSGKPGSSFLPWSGVSSGSRGRNDAGFKREVDSLQFTVYSLHLTFSPILATNRFVKTPKIFFLQTNRVWADTNICFLFSVKLASFSMFFEYLIYLLLSSGRRFERLVIKFLKYGDGFRPLSLLSLSNLSLRLPLRSQRGRVK
jgi:hypothetical protein